MSKKYTSYEFLNVLNSHTPQNVYLIYGEDHFLADRIMKGLIKRFTTPESLEFDFINLFGDEIQAENIIEQLEMYPFISESKLVVVHGFELLRDSERKKVGAYIQTIPESSILIVYSASMDGRSKLFKQFAKHVTVKTKAPAGYWEIDKWLNNELRNLKIRVSRNAVSLFSSKIEADYYTAYNELEKILIYIGNRQVITEDDISICMKNNRNNTVFELQNAIGDRNKRKALTILTNYLDAEEGKNAILLIAMLTKFFQVVWKVKFLQNKRVSDSEITSKYINEIHYSFRKDYIRFARNYSNKPIADIFDLLLEADFSLKSSGLGSKIIITKMVAEVML